MTPEQIEAKRQHWRAWYYRTHPKTTHVCENPECGKTFEGRKNRKFCSERCGRICWDKYRRGNVQLALISGIPAEAVDPKPQRPMLISAAQVRRLEGLKDYAPTPHVCRFYPPAYKCVCGKQGNVPARTYRLVTFQPVEVTG